MKDPNVFHLAERPPVAEAIEAAARCNTLEELYDAIRNYKGHDIAVRQGYTPNWPIKDNVEHPQGPLMIVIERPEEADRGEDLPFHGSSYGSAMKEVLEWYDVDLSQIHVTFAVHWSDGPEKSPNSTMISASRPFLYREIELVKPRAIMAQGKGVMEALLMYKGGITEVLEMTMDWKRGDLRIPVYATWHAAFPGRFQTQIGTFGEQVRGFFERFGMPDGSPAPKGILKRAA